MALVSELKSTLLRLELDWEFGSRTRTEVESIFWIVMLGHYATSGLGKVDWWSERLRRVTKELELRRWEDAMEVLKGFPYVGEVYGRDWENIWREQVMREGNEMVVVKRVKHPCSFCVDS